MSAARCIAAPVTIASGQQNPTVAPHRRTSTDSTGQAMSGVADVNPVIQLRLGASQTLRWKGLTRVHARDERVVSVHIDTIDNEDSIRLDALQAGETWLEIAHGNHEVTLLKVRISPSVPDENTAGIAGLENAKPLDAASLQAIEGGQVPGTGVGNPGSSVPIVPPAGAASSEPSSSAPTAAAPPLTTARLDSGPALRIAVEPSYGFDSRRLLFVRDTPNGPVITAVRSRSSFQSLLTTLRRRINARDTLTLDLPLLRRSENVRGVSTTFRSHNQGLGDIALGFERAFPGLAGGTVLGFAGANLQLPTGKSLFTLRRDNSATSSSLPLGSGHYEVSAFVGARKVADPLIANASLGLNYTLPRRAGEVRVAPGLGYSLQTGIAYALSDRMVLGEQLSFSRRTNVNLIGGLSGGGGSGQSIATLNEKVDQAYFTQSLLVNPRPGGSSYRLSFTVGLNDASLDYALSLLMQR